MSFFGEDEQFDSVVESTGEYARVDALNGHLVLVFPIGYVDHSPTKFTVPGKKSDAIVCDVVDLDQLDEAGRPGKLFRNTWWRGARLIMALRPRVGGKVLGTIGRGTATNGMNPPWVIADSSSDAVLVERARQWAREHANFSPSPFVAPISTGVPAMAPAAPPAGPPRFPVGQGNYDYPPQPPQSTYPQGPPANPYPPQPPNNYPPQGQPQWGGGQQPPPSGPGYGSPQNGGYPATGQQVTQEDMDTLAAMRRARETQTQQAYPTDPPF